MILSEHDTLLYAMFTSITIKILNFLLSRI